VKRKYRGFLRLLRKYSFMTAVVIFVLIGIGGELFFGGEYSGEGIVEYVVDGDTIEIRGLKQSVRYLGIDTPEVGDYGQPAEPLGYRAKEFNEQLVQGKQVKLEYDEEKYDKYGRLLAFVYVDGVLVNEALVREGLARVLFIDPNKKYLGRFEIAEEDAQKEQKGIWNKKARFTPPASNEQLLIEPSEAADFIGESVVVRGSVEGVRENRHVIALKLDGGFDVVIFRRDLPNFAFFRYRAQDFLSRQAGRGHWARLTL